MDDYEHTDTEVKRPPGMYGAADGHLRPPGIYGAVFDGKRPPPPILVLEGLQGTGKSTLARALGRAGAVMVRYTEASPMQAFFTPKYLYVSNALIVLDRWWHSRWVFRERSGVCDRRAEKFYRTMSRTQRALDVTAWYFTDRYDVGRPPPTAQERDRFEELQSQGLLVSAPPRAEIEAWVEALNGEGE